MTNPKIGFIGLGRMGRPMASNLQRKGFATLSYDVNPQGIAALVELGGRAAGSIAEVARESDIVFTMLPAHPEVRAVVLDGIVPNARPGTLVVDMSTIDPLATDEVAAAVEAAGLGFVDAPVGRLATHADRGECLFMVGASQEHFERVKPMLEAMGTTIHHCGPGTLLRKAIRVAGSPCQPMLESLPSTLTSPPLRSTRIIAPPAARRSS